MLQEVIIIITSIRIQCLMDVMRILFLKIVNKYYLYKNNISLKLLFKFIFDFIENKLK